MLFKILGGRVSKPVLCSTLLRRSGTNRPYSTTPPPPITGPPRYDTLLKRFSADNPSPLRFYELLETQEAIARGAFIDIHDTFYPQHYDVSIPDMNHEVLTTKLSKIIGIKYHQQVPQEEADKIITKVHRIIYGPCMQFILPYVMSVGGIARWVFFLVHTGAPMTYISTQVKSISQL